MARLKQGRNKQARTRREKRRKAAKQIKTLTKENGQTQDKGVKEEEKAEERRMAEIKVDTVAPSLGMIMAGLNQGRIGWTNRWPLKFPY